ncbi:glycoside hydrolase family 32 protein [Streptomyces sp. NBC_01754]|uniref:glycoside hydrolase family 32 protein n=1 Tax=Streptomyces sp. NBC_01754 TaxID=2975930 RepID=UPI002DDBDAFA|nr:glycoside hydrolase family 32 protein [Streptomyces sp. NBC_01754]WSC96371.1 glycoside hydrolase family 32 protein [Streptomyces sp. NBC_01754]
MTHENHGDAPAPDAHFPVAHLRPRRNWVNDPNGLVFHDGHYHVFFQYNPYGTEHAHMHWGHYRSLDLLHWELLPLALTPSPDGDDADGVWSGNAVSTGTELLAFYSAKREDRWWQPVTGAVSRDAGLTFLKRSRPLLEKAPAGTSMFRDPYVWQDGDHWRMLVGSALDDGRGAAQHYVSDDLEHWKHTGHFLARTPEPLPGGGDTEEGWECVQYAALDGPRGALLVSAWDPDGGAARAVVYTGRDEGTRFRAGPPQLLDHGPDFYAPAVMAVPSGPDRSARWLMWAWSWEARDARRVGEYSAWTEEAGWAGLLTLPRELGLDASGRLTQRPARETDALREEQVLDTQVTVAAGEAHDLTQIGAAFDLEARLHRSPGGTAATGIRLLTTTDGTEYLDIALDPATGDLVADRAHASLDSRARGGSWRLPEAARPGEGVGLRLVVDHSVAEIFLDDGRTLTLRFYPTGTAPWRLRATAAGTGSTTARLRAWRLGALRGGPAGDLLSTGRTST